MVGVVCSLISHPIKSRMRGNGFSLFFRPLSHPRLLKGSLKSRLLLRLYLLADKFNKYQQLDKFNKFQPRDSFNKYLQPDKVCKYQV
jgi:hypothetical protein